MNRLTLNVGGRWDKYVGELPDQTTRAAPFSGPRTSPARKSSSRAAACGASARRTT